MKVVRFSQVVKNHAEIWPQPLMHIQPQQDFIGFHQMNCGNLFSWCESPEWSFHKKSLKENINKLNSGFIAIDSQVSPREPPDSSNQILHG